MGRASSQTSRSVLHLLPVDIARGAQTYARAMRDELNSPFVRHRTAAIFTSDGSSLEADVNLNVVKGIGRRLGLSLRALASLRAEIRHSQPDIVVAHGGEALKYAALVVAPPVKLIYYKIGTSGRLLRNPMRRLFHRLLISRADLVAGVSKETVKEATALLGSNADRAVYIPNGRDPGVFRHQADPTEVAPVRFLFVGYFTRTKRPELFVETVTALRRRGVDARGTMVGDGPLLADMRRSAPKHIELLGSRSDVPELMSDADVFLFTSMAEGEGMPGVLIEAGLAGLPALATDVPGARTIIEHGITGLVIPVNAYPLLVDAAERLARQPDLRRVMGAAARQRCLDEFTLETSVEIWRSQLAQLLPRGET